MKNLILFVLAAIVFACSTSSQKNNERQQVLLVFFEDTFDKDSEGEYIKNVIGLPEPEGLGIKWKVLPGGNEPVNWILSDSCEPSEPRKGMWVIPPNSGYMEQGGRSSNSVLFINKPIPVQIQNYDILFKQYRNDNDPIMYVLGAAEPHHEAGFEFGCMIQVPGTDSTTNNAYIMGALGDTIVEEAAYRHVWAENIIEVRGENVRWLVNGNLMAKGRIEGLTPGNFGIRQRYERGTRFDDVKITILE